jgi:4'-phosphopantetheinyl transferase
MKTEMEWEPSIPSEIIAENQVCVWRLHLSEDNFNRLELYDLLVPEEQEKASRFHFEKDKMRYILTRGVLRKLLSFYLNQNPTTVSFEYNSSGKPILATDKLQEDLRFNLSHSGDFALIAFSHGRNIGIDLEQINSEFDYEIVAKNFFSPEEIESIEKTKKSKQHRLFFQYWTRKEAILKGLGKGLSNSMKELDVSKQNDQDWSPIQMIHESNHQEIWYGKDLSPVRGYAAAIAVEGGNCNLVCQEYSAGIK